LRHNCILVDGEGQPSEGEDASQPLPVGLGEVKLVEVKDPYYRYLVGDASAAYQGRLDKWLRHIAFVEPNYFVIYDEVAASSPKQFDWLLHAPSLGGAVPSLSVNGDLITLTGARGGELKVKVVEPEGFNYEILSYGTSMGTNYYVKMRPLVDEPTAQFLTVLFPDSVLDVTKVEAGNVIGVKVVDGDKLDLVLFSADGNPVNEYIELGDYYQAADGNTYTFDDTRVLASFDTYQVMRLVFNNPFRFRYLLILESFQPFHGHYFVLVIPFIAY